MAKAFVVLALASHAVGLRIPILRTTRPCLPLDCFQLQVPRGSTPTSHTGVLGLVHEEDPDIGTSGVLCECTSMCSGSMQAVAFARFRISGEVQQLPGTVMRTAQVEPLTDARGEQDEVARIRAERCVHLSFLQVARLASWSPDAAISASLAHISEEEREEMFLAVERFAPPPMRPARATLDECELPTEADGCRIAPESDRCLLERVYLRAARADGGTDGGTDGGSCDGAPRADGLSVARGTASSLEAFGCSRAELYSFAVSRLRDVSAAEATYLVRGRSTVERLRLAERHLSSSRAWLTQRLELEPSTDPASTGAGTAPSAPQRRTPPPSCSNRPTASGSHHLPAYDLAPAACHAAPLTRPPGCARRPRHTNHGPPLPR